MRIFLLIAAVVGTTTAACDHPIPTAKAADPNPPGGCISPTTVSPSSLTLVMGATAILVARIDACVATDPTHGAIRWASSDPTVAPVDSTGLVLGVAVGHATITASLVFDPTVKAAAAVSVVAQ